MKISLINWILAIVASLIMFQTLYFKFSAAPESVYIFSRIHAEPWGRILSGVVELIAIVFLLIPKLRKWGAILTIVVMSGAIVSHLFVLGIEVMDDKGLLFDLALITLLSALGVLVIEMKKYQGSFRKLP